MYEHKVGLGLLVIDIWRACGGQGGRGGFVINNNPTLTLRPCMTPVSEELQQPREYSGLKLHLLKTFSSLKGEDHTLLRASEENATNWIFFAKMCCNAIPGVRANTSGAFC